MTPTYLLTLPLYFCPGDHIIKLMTQEVARPRNPSGSSTRLSTPVLCNSWCLCYSKVEFILKLPPNSHLALALFGGAALFTSRPCLPQYFPLTTPAKYILFYPQYLPKPFPACSAHPSHSFSCDIVPCQTAHAEQPPPSFQILNQVSEHLCSLRQHRLRSRVIGFLFLSSLSD